MRNKALFLDRDGVINVDHGYVHRIGQIEFVEGIFDLTRAAFHKNYLIIVVTNQAGIGRGYYDEGAFFTLMDWMNERFAREGAPLAAVYHCPYHPEHGIGQWKQDHEDRKPKPGMILRAAREHDIDTKMSVLIGDRMTDIQAAHAANVGKALLLDCQNNHPGIVSIRTLYEAIAYL